MNLLLDTHIWVWTALEPERLGPQVASALEDDANTLWLSPISAWELIVLVEKRRLHLDMQPEAWINANVRMLSLREAAFTNEVVLRAREVTLLHRDLADRLLAATALTYGLTLVTADERLLCCRDIELFPNQ